MKNIISKYKIIIITIVIILLFVISLLCGSLIKFNNTYINLNMYDDNNNLLPNYCAKTEQLLNNINDYSKYDNIYLEYENTLDGMQSYSANFTWITRKSNQNNLDNSVSVSVDKNQKEDVKLQIFFLSYSTRNFASKMADYDITSTSNSIDLTFKTKDINLVTSKSMNGRNIGYDKFIIHFTINNDDKLQINNQWRLK